MRLTQEVSFECADSAAELLDPLTPAWSAPPTAACIVSMNPSLHLSLQGGAFSDSCACQSAFEFSVVDSLFRALFEALFTWRVALVQFGIGQIFSSPQQGHGLHNALLPQYTPAT